MKPWGDIKLSAQRARLLRVLDDRARRLCEVDDPPPFPIERSRRHFRRKLVRVLDARFVQLYSEGLENEAMHWFRTDLVRVLLARVEA